MKCGFFDPKKGVMLEVEDAPFSREIAASAAGQMRLLWKSGKHRLPSPYWCVWDDDKFSFFPLTSGIPSEELMDSAKAAAC